MQQNSSNKDLPGDTRGAHNHKVISDKDNKDIVRINRLSSLVKWGKSQEEKSKC